MKPITPRPHWWATCVLFLTLVSAMISCKTDTPVIIDADQKTVKINVKKNSARETVEVCLKANVDWKVIDRVVVKAKHTKGNSSITLTSTSDSNLFSYKEKKKHTLELEAKFYTKDGKVIKGDWCSQNGTDCEIPAEQKCSDKNAPIATVKSTVASGHNSVTVSVDER